MRKSKRKKLAKQALNSQFQALRPSLDQSPSFSPSVSSSSSLVPQGATALPPKSVEFSVGKSLRRLAVIRDQRLRLKKEELALGASLRAYGVSWAQLAAATRLTRSGAQNRFSGGTRTDSQNL